MIHQDLSQIEGCPERGVKVTVYGLNPWNCLLTFGVDAGPVRNKAESSHGRTNYPSHVLYRSVRRRASSPRDCFDINQAIRNCGSIFREI